MRWCFLF